MRGRCPYRLDFTEYYSTALWHLQDDVELSALAQELTAIDKHNSPQAWCAAGNCFSHLKEHENAIKFFQRAVQVKLISSVRKKNILWIIMTYKVVTFLKT